MGIIIMGIMYGHYHNNHSNSNSNSNNNNDNDDNNNDINDDDDNDDGDNNDNDDDVNDRMVLLQSSHHQASLPSTTSAALRCVRHHPYQSYQHYCKHYQKEIFLK